MSGSQKKLAKIDQAQSGFTLIEMIVTVGIIAVLAAVIVPSVGRFAGTGEQGAGDVEQEFVETAMTALMAEQVITAVNPWTGSGKTSTNSWSDKPTGGTVFLGDYLQGSTTVYFYCFNAIGQITAQHYVMAACP